MKTLSIGDAQDHISPEAIENCSTKLLPSGSLLMVVRGMILIHTFPVALTTCEVTINQDMKALTPTHAPLTDFILLTLRALESRVLNAVERSSHGTCKLNTEVLEALPIPLPPLAEQKRIVAKVDELMALCDRLEAQQNEREAKHAVLARAALARFAEAPTPANLEYLFHNAYTIDSADLRKSVLTMAVQGKLVPQIASDQARTTKPTLSEIGEDEELPFAIPSGWSWARVEDVAESRLGKMLDVEKNRGEPHPYLRNTNVHWFRFELDNIKTMLLSQSELEDFRLQRGDVMICEGGHGIARSAVWEEQFPGMMFQKALHRVRPSASLDPYFFTFCLRVYEAEGILQRYYTGAGIPHFTGRSLAKVIFPLPPLAEQRRIVAKVNALMALVDRLEAQLAESRALAGRLLEAVVAELTQPTAGKAASDASPRIGMSESDETVVDADEPEESIDSASPVIVEAKATTTDLFGYPDQYGQYLRNGATVAALVIQRMGKGNGKTFIEKNLHLVESFCGVPMGRRPKRMAHGPADLKQHDAIMDWAANADAFLSKTSDKGQRVDYTRGEAFDAFIADAGRVLGEKLASVEALIAKLRPLSSRNAEWVATAYGSWNDFIIDDIAAPSDEQIIKDIYRHWHVSKQDVPEKNWRRALKWLRDNNLIPSGNGPRVRPADNQSTLGGT